MQNLSSINYLNLLIELIFHGISEFKPVTKEICKVPSFFSTALFRKIDSDSTGVVTRYVYSPRIIELSYRNICHHDF